MNYRAIENSTQNGEFQAIAYQRIHINIGARKFLFVNFEIRPGHEGNNQCALILVFGIMIEKVTLERGEYQWSFEK